MLNNRYNPSRVGPMSGLTRGNVEMGRNSYVPSVNAAPAAPYNYSPSAPPVIDPYNYSPSAPPTGNPFIQRQQSPYNWMAGSKSRRNRRKNRKNRNTRRNMRH